MDLSPCKKVVIPTSRCLLKAQRESVGFFFERNSLTGEVSAGYVATVDNLARKSSNGIGCLRTDEGSDWKSSAVAEVVQDRGIRHQYALVDAHGQIGPVESRFRLYQEGANAILRQSGAPIKFKFRAIKFINYIQNNVVRGETSRLYDLLGVQSAVTFYPFWCRVTSVAPRRKQGELGTGKSYRLVGYSSHHKGGYQLWNEDTDRVVVRGMCTALPSIQKTLRHTQTHTHKLGMALQAATRPSLMPKRMAFKVAVVLQVGQVTANLCRCLAFHMLMILALISAVSTPVLTVAVEG